MRWPTAPWLAVLLLSAAPAGAQTPVSLQFDQGRVTLSAQNVPVRSILNEWARIGGATIVNADRVSGGPVTIEFVGVPERQALDVLLRGVAGYVLGPRAPGSTGASAFDRILILPTTVVPAAVASNTPASPATAAAERPRPPVPLPAFLARRPDLGVEGPRQPRPQGAQPGATGIFGPDFREHPPVPPAARVAPVETRPDDPAPQTTKAPAAVAPKRAQ